MGHFCNAIRGPFTIDVLERDRKVIYECNHAHRFYASSLEKIATYRLQERITKAMGYKVVQIPFWHWHTVRYKKPRVEYVRMSRYYAVKDRREFKERPLDHVAEGQVPEEFAYMGESFGNSAKPIRTWSWFERKVAILPQATA